MGDLMTERELTDLVTELASKTNGAVALVLLDSTDGARARYAIEGTDDLLNAAVTLLCAANERLTMAAPECQGCAAKLQLVDAALRDLGFPPSKRGAGGAMVATRAVH